MKKIMFLITIAFVGMLMSFTPAAPGTKPSFKTIDIDLTFTSQGGCTFHVVGEANINVFKMKITSFTGTITMSGPAGCPQGTFNVSMATFQADAIDPGAYGTGESLGVQFNTDNVCNISSVTFSTDSPGQAIQETRNALNGSAGFKTEFVSEIKKEADCR